MKEKDKIGYAGTRKVFRNKKARKQRKKVQFAIKKNK